MKDISKIYWVMGINRSPTKKAASMDIENKSSGESTRAILVGFGNKWSNQQQ